ncbi:hypothetical protein Csa_003448 [Cucumis sativus]|uniref:Uncharacterized protein n=1 Tax=Cucumis sativus TaxID=3659 RepID=A0A0A0KIA1_CUCSA|nr:hypothetical protein Csa_003448 [Cucumis sativus]
MIHIHSIPLFSKLQTAPFSLPLTKKILKKGGGGWKKRVLQISIIHINGVLKIQIFPAQSPFFLFPFLIIGFLQSSISLGFVG